MLNSYNDDANSIFNSLFLLKNFQWLIDVSNRERSHSSDSSVVNIDDSVFQRNKKNLFEKPHQHPHYKQRQQQFAFKNILCL